MAADADWYQSVFDEYSAQRPVFAQVGDHVADVLAQLKRELGLVYAEISARAKEVESVVQKVCVRRKADSLEDMHDRAGTRLTVPYRADVERAKEWLEQSSALEVRSIDDKLESLGNDRVGYLGVHLDVVVPRDVIDNGSAVEGELWCEIQVRTAVQTAWAIVSHDLSYKSDPMPDEVGRRFNRLTAVAEIFDDEIHAVRERVLADPAMQWRRVLNTARTLFGRFVAQPGQEDTSALTVPLLLQLYSSPELQQLETLLTEYVDLDHEHLAMIYERRDTRASPLLLQPESVLILERLNSDPYLARDLWPVDDLPISLLTGMALVDGREKPMRVTTS